jgi:3-isopropylmalate dehydrogenase
MKKTFSIALLPGDGIGPEVIREAVKIIDILASKLDLGFEMKESPVGGSGYEATGHPLPEETLAVARQADAVLLGAVGGPKWETIDFSPALVDSSTLKKEVVEGLDIMVIRELTGGIYFGEPRGVETMEDGTRRGFNTLVYTEPEIERIARVAFDVVGKRGKKVMSVDKANVLEVTGFWREVVSNVHKDYPDITLDHMYVDNAAMQLVRNPKQFDVVLTTNMFGDILSDQASMLTGSIGMLPSASLGGGNAMYEPIHGSAPDIAGQELANPLATILSVGMMFKYSFENETANTWLENAVENVLGQGFRTRDIMSAGMKEVGTQEMGDLVATELEKTSGNL